jgi:hypothetical protein
MTGGASPVSMAPWVLLVMQLVEHHQSRLHFCLSDSRNCMLVHTLPDIRPIQRTRPLLIPS